MSHNKVTILDIPINNLSREEFLGKVYEDLNVKQQNVFIVTANPEIIMNAAKLPSYRQSILQADYIVPDGTGVIMASQILEQPLAEKITGYDLVHTFLAYASEQKKSVYFYGSKEGVAVKAAINAAEMYPGVKIAGTKHGYSGFGDEVAMEIAETKPDFVFVGLGAPLQETWIADYKELFPESVLMGVGGSFDVLSGKSKRAPKFWLDHNLEWMYRLLTQPVRFVRMLQLPVYLGHVYQQKRKDAKANRIANKKIL